VATKEEPSAGELTEIVSAMINGMGADCQVDVSFVTDIPALPSGKYRYTVSMLEE
jgi:hypothetical protein